MEKNTSFFNFTTPQFWLEQKSFSLVTQILTAEGADPNADTANLKSKIDVLIYRLYGLTHAEVLVVDPEFGRSEGAYSGVEVE